MTTIKQRSGESNAQMLRRFRQVVSRSGVLRDVRQKRWFISRSEQRRMEKKKAIRRSKRKARKRG